MGENNPDDTGDTPTFQESLGDHSSNELFTDITDVSGLAGKFIEINTNLSEAQANAPVVPESMDDYAYDVVEGATPYEEANLTAIKQFAHDNKWSAETFKQALQLDQETSKGMVDAHNAQIDEAQTALKAEMGDNYEPGVLLVKQVLGKFGAEGLQDRTDALVRDPDVFRLIHAFGKAISPDMLDDVGSGGGGTEKSMGATLYDGK